MSTSNIGDVVRHYQRSIEKHGDDETRLLHCISKLFNLPIKFEHLQETGIGKTVNALRKLNGDVSVAAKTLVTKWKAMVTAEGQSPEQSQSQQQPIQEDNSTRRSSDEDQDQENKGSNSASSGGEERRKRERDSKKSHHKSGEREHKSRHHHQDEPSSSSSNGKNHHKSSSSSSKSESDKKHKSSHRDKTKEHHHNQHQQEHKKEEKREHKSREGEREREPKATSSNTITTSSETEKHQKHHHQHHHSKSSAESQRKSSKSSSTHEKTKEEKVHSTDRHKISSSTSSKSSKRPRSSEAAGDESPKAKQSKSKESKSKSDPASNESTADGFDSTMGANFDDVLGMLNMPMSSKKVSSSSKSKSTSNSKSHQSAAVSSSTVTSSTSSSSVDKSKPRTSIMDRSAPAPKFSTARKPDLLNSSAKLEPLDPSIALELPTISNNYKPMPLNQTVMDVVFNQAGSNSSSSSQKPPPQRVFNESEALAAGISSKTMRTKIYSGVKTGQILQVPSLFDLCIRVLQKNIDALEYTGGVPFEVLKPVLERATPQQLLNFEEYNPYLMDDSDVLWKQHVQRHCRSQQREEMETWREMFLRCQEEKDRKLSILAESIKASQKISEAPVRKTQLAFVDSMVKPPRSVQRKQEQYGTNRKLIATPAARVAALSSVTPNAAKVGDTRLRVVAGARDTAQIAAAPMRAKKAPLMAKTLQFMRGRHKR